MNEPCCCDYYQLYNIPHTFIIARHQYDVELTIRVALRMKCGEQIKNSFWHAFNFYYSNRQDESLAQTFANFMCEYELTRE